MTDSHDTDDEDTTFRNLRQSHLELQRLTYIDTLRRMRVKHAEAVHIELYEQPQFDDYGTVTIGEWGGYRIQILPMGFNDRLALNPKTAQWGYDHGWCYDKGGAAILAALVWDPETEAEPPGYKKRATHGLRKAGQKASNVDLNWLGEELMRLLEK